MFQARDAIAGLVPIDTTDRPGVIHGTVETMVALGMALFTRLGVLVPNGVEAKVGMRPCVALSSARSLADGGFGGQEMRNYCKAIAKQYNGVPYHNALHAGRLAPTSPRLGEHAGLTDLVQPTLRRPCSSSSTVVAWRSTWPHTSSLPRFGQRSPTMWYVSTHWLVRWPLSLTPANGARRDTPH